MTKPVPIVIFWHTYLNLDFKIVVQEQMTKLFTSGLYTHAEKIFVGVSSPCQENGLSSDCKSNIDWMKRLLSNYKKFEITVHRDGDAEKSTLRLLSNYCLESERECHIMYFHTKAVSNTGYNNVLWRWSMDFHMIYRWKDCIKELKDFDAVGINLRKNTHLGYHPHFSGNYWWSKVSYIQTLQENYLYDREYLKDIHPKANILLAEFYIGSNHDGNLISIFDCGDNEPYNMECSVNKYLPKKMNTNEIE